MLADRVAVLVDGRIALDVAVDFDRPRMRGIPGFADMRRRFLHALGVTEAIGGVAPSAA